MAYYYCYIQNCSFVLNMTRHASHQNCAPVRVFEFYTLALLPKCRLPTILLPTYFLFVSTVNFSTFEN
jgi:hypothetical protein